MLMISVCVYHVQSNVFLFFFVDTLSESSHDSWLVLMSVLVLVRVRVTVSRIDRLFFCMYVCAV